MPFHFPFDNYGISIWRQLSYEVWEWLWMDRASSYHLSIRHDFCLDFNIFDYLSFAAGWLVGWLVSYS